MTNMVMARFTSAEEGLARENARNSRKSGSNPCKRANAKPRNRANGTPIAAKTANASRALNKKLRFTTAENGTLA